MSRRIAVVKRTLAAIVAAGGLALLGCSGDSTGTWAGTVYDSAGVTIVDNPESGLWTSSSAWRFKEELRIGAADGDQVREFGVIAGIAVDESGQIYVLDRQAREIRVFDPEGAYLRRFGRPGGGPGEFAFPSAVLLGKNDMVFVPDSRNQRVNRFLTDGSEAGSFPILAADGIPLDWRIQPDGSLLQEVRTLPIPGAGEERILILVRGGDGGIRDTIAEMAVGKAMVIRDGQPQMTMFAPEPLWTALSDGRIATGRNSQYRLEIRTGDGALDRVVRMPFERRSFSHADRRTVRELIQESLQGQGPSPATDHLLQSMDYAEHYPVYAALFAGPHGTLWVRHTKDVPSLTLDDMSALDIRAFGASDYDVFDRTGRFLGSIALADRFEPMYAQDEHIYGVERDELGVSYVVRLRVGR